MSVGGHRASPWASLSLSFRMSKVGVDSCPSDCTGLAGAGGKPAKTALCRRCRIHGGAEEGRLTDFPCRLGALTVWVM